MQGCYSLAPTGAPMNSVRDLHAEALASEMNRRSLELRFLVDKQEYFERRLRDIRTGAIHLRTLDASTFCMLPQPIGLHHAFCASPYAPCIIVAGVNSSQADLPNWQHATPPHARTDRYSRVCRARANSSTARSSSLPTRSQKNAKQENRASDVMSLNYCESSRGNRAVRAPQSRVERTPKEARRRGRGERTRCPAPARRTGFVKPSRPDCLGSTSISTPPSATPKGPDTTKKIGAPNGAPIHPLRGQACSLPKIERLSRA